MLLIFFTVPVTTVHQKYFIFKWLSSGALTIYKKCLNPVFECLGQEGHLTS